MFVGSVALWWGGGACRNKGRFSVSDWEAGQAWGRGVREGVSGGRGAEGEGEGEGS